MRKRQMKQLIVLTSVTVLLAVLLALMPVLFPTEKMELINMASVPVYSVEENSVTKLSWSFEGKSYQLVRTAKGWAYGDKPDLPLDQVMIGAMLEKACQINAEKTMDDVSDLSIYGLDDPECTVTVTTAEGETQIQMGGTNALGTDRYITNGDGKVYLVKASIITPFRYSIIGVVEKEDVPDLGEASSVTINNGTETVAMDYRLIEGETYGWFAGEQRLNDTAVNKLLRPISLIRWKSCVAYDAAEEDMAQYGLDAPVAMLTSVEGEKTITVEIGGSAGDKAVYARISGSSFVYTIGTDVTDPIMSMTLVSLLP